MRFNQVHGEILLQFARTRCWKKKRRKSAARNTRLGGGNVWGNAAYEERVAATRFEECSRVQFCKNRTWTAMLFPFVFAPLSQSWPRGSCIVSSCCCNARTREDPRVCFQASFKQPFQNWEEVLSYENRICFSVNKSHNGRHSPRMTNIWSLSSWGWRNRV